METILSVKTLTTPFSKSCCYLKRWCKKDRHMNTQSRIAARVEGSLDICKILDTQTNIRLLLHLLLSKNQHLLFRNHRSRIIDPDSDATEDEDEDQLLQEKKEGLANLLGFKPIT
jgi:hypothetical protein